MYYHHYFLLLLVVVIYWLYNEYQKKFLLSEFLRKSATLFSSITLGQFDRLQDFQIPKTTLDLSRKKNDAKKYFPLKASFTYIPLMTKKSVWSNCHRTNGMGEWTDKVNRRVCFAPSNEGKKLITKLYFKVFRFGIVARELNRTDYKVELENWFSEIYYCLKACGHQTNKLETNANRPLSILLFHS